MYGVDVGQFDWRGSLGMYGEDETDSIPQWYQDMLDTLTLSEEYEENQMVSGESIIDYIDTHHPDAAPQA